MQASRRFILRRVLKRRAAEALSTLTLTETTTMTTLDQARITAELAFLDVIEQALRPNDGHTPASRIKIAVAAMTEYAHKITMAQLRETHVALLFGSLPQPPSTPDNEPDTIIGSP